MTRAPRGTDPARPVVVAFGRRGAGCDAAGPLVLDALSDGSPGLDLIHARPDPADLLDALSGRKAAFLVDACRRSAPPGTVHVLDLTAAPLPARPRASHGVALADCIALVRSLGGLPPLCRLYAIEGADFTEGRAPAPVVAAAARTVAAAILDATGRTPAPAPP